MSRQSTTIHTDNPNQSLWLELSFFESEGNTQQFLRQRFPRKYGRPSSLVDAAQQLSYAVKQANEFYDAASHMSSITSPLMYFYGMSNLVVALMVACSGQVVMSSSHGLGKVFRNITSADVDTFTIEVHGQGTFHNFYGCYSTPRRLKGTSWSLKELLSVIPELEHSFAEVYGEKSRVVKVVRRVHRDRRLAYIDDDRFADDANEVDVLIPRLHECYLLPPQLLPDGGLVLHEKIGASEDITIRSVLGERYFILSTEKGACYYWLPELSSHYMLMFALSMLVRYEARAWGECITKRLTGLPYLVERFLAVSARKFPNMILDEIKNRSYWFVQETKKDIDERVILDAKELYQIVKTQEHKESLKKRTEKLMMDLME